jgi:HSP20 family protein
MEQEMDRLFDDFRSRMGLPSLFAWEPRWPSVSTRLHMGALDVYEKGNTVIVKAELPGMTKDDVEVLLSDNTLTVRGEKRVKEEVKAEDYYRRERSFGSVSRTVTLPSEVKADAVKATFKDGVLEIRLPKTEEAKRKATKVNVE